MRITGRNRDIDEQCSKISMMESALSSIQRIRKERETKLIDMIDAYERALSTSTVSMPFPGLRAAKTGDWVVVEKGCLARYAERIGFTVLFEDGTNFEELPAVALFRVTALDNKKMLLSRVAAYLPVQAC